MDVDNAPVDPLRKARSSALQQGSDRYVRWHVFVSNRASSSGGVRKRPKRQAMEGTDMDDHDIVGVFFNKYRMRYRIKMVYLKRIYIY